MHKRTSAQKPTPQTVRIADMLLDGKLFRRQRAMLARLLHCSRNSPSVTLTARDRKLLSGLENLCDAIADDLDQVEARTKSPSSDRSRRRQR